QPSVPPTSVPGTPLTPTRPAVDPGNNPMNIPCVGQAGAPLPPVSGQVKVPDPSVDVTYGACGLADQQFLNNRSIVTDNYGKWDCDATPVFTQLWEQQLANCLGGYQSASDCASKVQSEITNSALSKIPAVPNAPATPADQSLADIKALLAAKGEQAANTNVCTPGLPVAPAACIGAGDLVQKIKDVQNVVCANAALPATCLQPLIDRLGNAGVQLDLRMLAPALLTPAVQVQVNQDVAVPGLSLVGLGHQGVKNT